MSEHNSEKKDARSFSEAKPITDDYNPYKLEIESFSLPVNEAQLQNLDVAVQLLADDDFEYTKEEANRVLRKIDLVLMPLMCITYALQYLDKVALSYAALFGMIEEAHLHGSEYSWLTTIFYLGYLVAQYPGAYILQKLPNNLFLFVNTLCWSAMVMLMAACSNAGGLLALRFLMGVFEACVSPAFVSITSMWYRREEQTMRSMLWYSFNGVATIIGGILSYGIGHIHNSHVSTWKFIFIIIGGLSLAWAGIFYLLFPSNPVTARFLTPRELWLFVFITGTYMISNGITVFNSIIIKGLGFSTFRTTLFNMPSGAVEFVVLVITGLISTRIKRGRIFIALVGTALTIVAAGLVWKLKNPWGRMVGIWIYFGSPICFVTLLSLVASNVAGYTKKMVVGASIFVFYSIGNIVSPQLFKSSQSPTYDMGMEAIFVSCSITFGLWLALLYYYIYQNRIRDKKKAESSDQSQSNGQKNEEFMDLTDKQQASFRYLW
ncbi:allantoate permease [Schizosaccharomyces japonicus yFS275]|uniref:Allantoate permease n=1 Tax=Schizosaccharomyces japonicus (strain yFS275 / FY16936) TaxID=402676 RepID=B6JXQ8_SCHJY|nr:allantoate permease [Schizosaccharomyces japonicus yFS275]EEB05202.1 allantoate permease [Schizosaccharomyces japonicus yFS275]